MTDRELAERFRMALLAIESLNSLTEDNTTSMHTIAKIALKVTDNEK